MFLQPIEQFIKSKRRGCRLLCALAKVWLLLRCEDYVMCIKKVSGKTLAKWFDLNGSDSSLVISDADGKRQRTLTDRCCTFPCLWSRLKPGVGLLVS